MKGNGKKRAAEVRGGSDRSLGQYLREIDRYPLLREAEEKQLARRIRAGDREALDKLVRSNLRFVVSVAKKYQNRGLTLSDLIAEGNIGLIRAARKFHESKDTKFISYAVWWVRQAVLQALAEQSRLYRVPLSRAGLLYRLGKRSSVLFQQLQREPTVGELADALGISRPEVEETLAIAIPPLSLDSPPSSDEERNLVEFLADAAHPLPSEQVMEEARTQVIRSVLDSLDHREARILRLYFGLDDEGPLTLEQIGHILGITRERVRQLKERALDRLRHPSRRSALEAFVE